MRITISVGNQTVPFRLDFTNERWHSLDELGESDFPLIAEVEGKRYELYSDGTMAEAELDPRLDKDRG